MRVRFLAPCVVVAALLAGCGLNPQPEPPSASTNGAAGAGGASSEDEGPSGSGATTPLGDPTSGGMPPNGSPPLFEPNEPDAMGWGADASVVAERTRDAGAPDGAAPRADAGDASVIVDGLDGPTTGDGG